MLDELALRLPTYSYLATISSGEDVIIQGETSEIYPFKSDLQCLISIFV